MTTEEKKKKKNVLVQLWSYGAMELWSHPLTRHEVVDDGVGTAVGVDQELRDESDGWDQVIDSAKLHCVSGYNTGTKQFQGVQKSHTVTMFSSALQRNNLLRKRNGHFCKSETTIIMVKKNNKKKAMQMEINLRQNFGKDISFSKY